MNKYKSKKNPEKSFYSTKNVILRKLGSGKLILDVGCNDGYFGKFDKNNVYYGIDYSQEALREAKKIYKDAIIYDLNNLQKLPWNIKFDTIIFADVLEHVLYPNKVLDFFVKKYLKNGASVAISLPNIANWQVRLCLLFGNFDYIDTGILDETHLHFYTFKSAKFLISKSNLIISGIFSGATLFGFIISVFPFLKSLLATNIVLIAKKTTNVYKNVFLSLEKNNHDKQ